MVYTGFEKYLRVNINLFSYVEVRESAKARVSIKMSTEQTFNVGCYVTPVHPLCLRLFFTSWL